MFNLLASLAERALEETRASTVVGTEAEWAHFADPDERADALWNALESEPRFLARFLQTESYDDESYDDESYDDESYDDESVYLSRGARGCDCR
jgi:hypothetical protein